MRSGVASPFVQHAGCRHVPPCVCPHPSGSQPRHFPGCKHIPPRPPVDAGVMETIGRGTVDDARRALLVLFGLACLAAAIYLLGCGGAAV